MELRCTLQLGTLWPLATFSPQCIKETQKFQMFISNLGTLWPIATFSLQFFNAWKTHRSFKCLFIESERLTINFAMYAYAYPFSIFVFACIFMWYLFFHFLYIFLFFIIRHLLFVTLHGCHTLKRLIIRSLKNHSMMWLLFFNLNGFSFQLLLFFRLIKRSKNKLNCFNISPLLIPDQSPCSLSTCTHSKAVV